MEEDERREAAIASNPCLRPNFKPPGITQNQLNKFQELHRRRLQIKSKLKNKKKPKDEMGKFQEEVNKKTDNPDENSNEVVKDSCAAVGSNDSKDISSCPKIDINHILKKRKKLHWGLDTKERWERKANM